MNYKPISGVRPNEVPVKFFPVYGSGLSEEQAQQYGEFIFSLIKDKGNVTPEELVAEVEKSDHPIKEWSQWEWNDKKAAKRYRDFVAYKLLKYIEVDVILPSSEETRVRAFQPAVKRDGTKQSGYVPTVRVFQKPDFRKQLVRRALNEAKAWRKRYETYRELAKVFDAIDAVSKELD